MPMKVQAAVITQKRASAEFNTDSININGKVLPREIIQNGYKGAGNMSEPVCFAVSSSPVDGFADAAVAALNERIDNLNTDTSGFYGVINEYFKDSVYALSRTGHDSSELISSCIYGSGRSVIMAKTGDASLYAFADGKLSVGEPSLLNNDDGKSSFGICEFTNPVAGDIFLLLSAGVTDVLTFDDIEDILKVSEGSVKKAVNLFSKVAAAKECDKAITVIAVAVTEAQPVQEGEPRCFVNLTAPAADSDAPTILDEELNSFIEEPEEVQAVISDVQPEDAEENKPAGHRIGFYIAASVLILIIIFALAVFVKGLIDLNGKSDITTVESTTEESTTVQAEETTLPETTTAEETTTAKAVSNVPSTTKKATVTKAPTTTKAPSTTAPVTQAPTTQKQEEPATTPDTTAAPDSTTAPETTSAPATSEPSTGPVTAAPQTTAAPDTEPPVND